MPLWTAGAMAVISVGTAIAANQSAKKDRKAAREAMAAGMAEIEKAGTPPDLSGPLLIEFFKAKGIYTPEMEEDIQVAQSQLAQLKEDPTLRTAQMGALADFAELKDTGLSFADRVALQKIKDQVEKEAQGRSGQLEQTMQARGMAGSGSEIAAQLANAQSAEQIMSDNAAEVAAQAQQARINALSQYANLATQTRGQDWDISSKKAAAQDQLNQFNAEMSSARQSRNIAAKNVAKQQDWSNQQQSENANVQLRNQETNRQNEARRTYWLDKLNLAKAKAGQYSDQVAFSQGEAARKSAMWGGIGSAGITAVGAYGASKKGGGGSSSSGSNDDAALMGNGDASLMG